LWDVEAPTFSRQSAHRWRWGCESYALAGRPLPTGRFLELISVRCWFNPRATVRLEILDQLKNPMISSGIEPFNTQALWDAGVEAGLEASTTKYMLLSRHKTARRNHAINTLNKSFGNVTNVQILGKGNTTWNIPFRAD
jgi:hypothetical protein